MSRAEPPTFLILHGFMRLGLAPALVTHLPQPGIPSLPLFQTATLQLCFPFLWWQEDQRMVGPHGVRD